MTCACSTGGWVSASGQLQSKAPTPVVPWHLCLEGLLAPRGDPGIPEKTGAGGLVRPQGTSPWRRAVSPGDGSRVVNDKPAQVSPSSSDITLVRTGGHHAGKLSAQQDQRFCSQEEGGWHSSSLLPGAWPSPGPGWPAMSSRETEQPARSSHL